MRFATVPWAPSLELVQLTRDNYVEARCAAVVWQVGIRKGFDREMVKARLASEPRHHATTIALELGMLDAECDGLADEWEVKGDGR